MKNAIAFGLVVALLLALSIDSAMAVVTMPNAAAIAAEIAPVLAFGGLVIAALLGFLGVRKGIKTVNRS